MPSQQLPLFEQSQISQTDSRLNQFGAITPPASRDVSSSRIPAWNLSNKSNRSYNPRDQKSFMPRFEDPVPSMSSSTQTSTLDTLYERYQQLKTTEDKKNALIEELLIRYDYVNKQLAKEAADHERECDYIRQTYLRGQALNDHISHLRTFTTRSSFVLVLIDGDRMVFNDDLFSGKSDDDDLLADDGKVAASSLHDAVRKYVTEELPNLDPKVNVVARIYANVLGLGHAYQRRGVLSTRHSFYNFTRGFNTSGYMFDFIDAGDGRDGADTKIKDMFNFSLQDPGCQQIFLACSYDSGYIDILNTALLDETSQDRVTLFEGPPFLSSTSTLPFRKHKISGLFKFNGLKLWDLPAGSEPRVNRKENTPETPVARTNSTSLDMSKPSPVSSWASAIAKSAATLPSNNRSFTTTASTSNASPTKDAIPRNRKGQRIDPLMKHDKEEVDRVKKLKMCNVHYLRRECPYVDTCTHVHDYKPTTSEIQTLKLVARMAPCMHGSECVDEKCLYGHNCPAPEGRDGQDCIFGSACRFPSTLHRIDRTVVKTLRV